MCIFNKLGFVGLPWTEASAAFQGPDCDYPKHGGTLLIMIVTLSANVSFLAAISNLGGSDLTSREPSDHLHVSCLKFPALYRW